MPHAIQQRLELAWRRTVIQPLVLGPRDGAPVRPVRGEIGEEKDLVQLHGAEERVRLGAASDMEHQLAHLVRVVSLRPGPSCLARPPVLLPAPPPTSTAA